MKIKKILKIYYFISETIYQIFYLLLIVVYQINLIQSVLFKNAKNE